VFDGGVLECDTLVGCMDESHVGRVMQN
jgi:hypothetical protein